MTLKTLVNSELQTIFRINSKPICWGILDAQIMYADGDMKIITKKKQYQAGVKSGTIDEDDFEATMVIECDTKV